MPAGLTASDTMFSVRETPWHGLGAVLDEYPTSIDDALDKSGLGWHVRQDPIYVGAPLGFDLADASQQPVGREGIFVPQLESNLIAVPDYRANVRADTGSVLGIVSDDYRVVQNVEAFKFLDALIGSDLHFETAGSLRSGRRVWVLVRLPEFVEVGGDPTATYVYVANSHDGSMAVTSAVTPVRIVCQNTLGLALRGSERSDRTYKFRHTGDLALKFDEARKVMGLTVNYAERFKALGDELAREPFGTWQFEKFAKTLVGADDPDLGDRAKNNRTKMVGTLLDLYHGRGDDGDTRGNSPRSKWCALNAVGEFSDWQRRYTKNTDQVARSFEDHDLKQQALALLTS